MSAVAESDEIKCSHRELASLSRARVPSRRAVAPRCEQRRHVRQQVELLEHEADVPVADVGFVSQQLDLCPGRRDGRSQRGATARLLPHGERRQLAMREALDLALRQPAFAACARRYKDVNDTGAAQNDAGRPSVSAGDDYRADALGWLPAVDRRPAERDGSSQSTAAASANRGRPCHACRLSGGGRHSCQGAARTSTWHGAQRIVVEDLRRVLQWYRRGADGEEGAGGILTIVRATKPSSLSGGRQGQDRCGVRRCSCTSSSSTSSSIASPPIRWTHGAIGMCGQGRGSRSCGFQRPWLFRDDIARTTLNIPESELRLVTGDIGGSYGLRGSMYPEIILMLWAARRVGRPVKWTQTRNEAHISDDDARDNIVDAALALDRDGKFLGVRIRSYGNLGAFVSFRGAMPPVVNIGTVVGTYTTPALHVAVSGMLTNTHCTSPYRGAGRPEASYMIERLVDIAADELKIDPAELRRRNTIPPDRMPYKTPLTFTYDSGHFAENLDRTMRLANWSQFETRRKEAARRGMLRGIGISNTIEQAADPTYETAEIRFDPLGGMTFVTGSISHGQGHNTIQTQMLVDRLESIPSASSSSPATPMRWRSAWAPAVRARPR